MFDKVLIANRGEIALRIVRACRELGIASVAVYSTEDEDSTVVRAADEAVRIGPAPARWSYLNIPAIIEAAVRTRASAIHPGYGFLSEDPDFAEICENAGLVFIGPPSAELARLSDKSSARDLMTGAGLPLLPGGTEPLENAKVAARLAAKIGYPLVIKAVAGGGGRGIHIARTQDELPEAYAKARADAQAFFADGRVYSERFLEPARHVEVQILCDSHGNALSLGERDCTIQRRNQKLIEETPAPRLPAQCLAEMRQAAVHGALEAGFVGAGTFEFLVDDEHRFYFMEVNCRIQVEHPVTEMVTGIDLVHEQIRIAAGRPLGFSHDINPRGAAIECRINAEDPDRDFAPTPGVLEEFSPPGGPFVRVDTHCFPGMRISPAYDSLLAKVIVWAPERAGAIARMRRALAEFRIHGTGVVTTTHFLDNVLGQPAFLNAEHSTSTIPTFEASMVSASSGN